MALAVQPQANPSLGDRSQQTPQSSAVITSLQSQSSSRMQRQLSAPSPMGSNCMYNHSPIPTVSPLQHQNQVAFSYFLYQSPPLSTPLVSVASVVDQGNFQSMEKYQHYSLIPRRESVSSPATLPTNPQSPINQDHVTPDSTAPGSYTSSPITLSPIDLDPLIAARLNNSKTLSYNETLDPADRIDFKTDVDELMKVIQWSRVKEDHQQLPTPAPTPEHTATPPSTFLTQSGKPKKRWICDGPNCGRAFTQKTHRDIHQRTHTGERPYVCDKANCGLTFSQQGNLRTHIRRHTGEKPYRCTQCTKCFAQRGNLRSHEETHKGLSPFICRLDNCNKSFSSLGNMKTHQNNSHKATLKNIVALFVQFSKEGEVPEAYQELFDYFQKHYKNSNKGVKGRRKTRALTARGPIHPVASQVSQLAMPAQDPMVSSSPNIFPPGSTDVLSSSLRIPDLFYSRHGLLSPPQMGVTSQLPY